MSRPALMVAAFDAETLSERALAHLYTQARVPGPDTPRSVSPELCDWICRVAMNENLRRGGLEVPTIADPVFSTPEAELGAANCVMAWRLEWACGGLEAYAASQGYTLTPEDESLRDELAARFLALSDLLLMGHRPGEIKH